jgi:glycosyltransferase involved in cell wall biosynthesis
LSDKPDSSRAKPVVLTFARYYLPGYKAGGPIRSIKSIVQRLSQSFEFRIVALDRDLGGHSPYPGVQQHRWLPLGDGFVRYVSPETFGFAEIADIVGSTPHDLIYLNSFFDPLFTQCVLVNHRLGRLAGRPIVLAPRGEFSEEAVRLKRLKKRTLVRLGKWLGLYDGLTWQASSVREAQDIRRALSIGDANRSGVLNGRIVIASNLTDSDNAAAPLSTIQDRPIPEGPLRICFLSRISPMKNLDFALRVLAQVRVPVRFAIYGPLESAEYWAKCEALFAQLPENITVVRHEGVEPAQIVSTLAQHDLFLLPTRGENFGHVIYEALRAGLPVLISDKTPWRNLQDPGVGWDLPLSNIADFVGKIEDVARWSAYERSERSLRSREFAAKVRYDKTSVEATRQLFFAAIEGHQSRTR